MPADERAEVLAALACVDAVVVFDEPTAEALVAVVQPDVYVKGDYYHEATLPEARVVRGYGGRVELLPTIPGVSTSSLVQRIRQQAAAPHGPAGG